MRPIDADALQQIFNEVSTSLMRKPALTKDIEHMVRAFLMTTEMINDAPTIEVEPVMHGRWIRAEAKGYPVKRSSIWYCSECGEKIKYNDTLGRYQKTKRTVSQVNPRCRKCGARMDGGAD